MESIFTELVEANIIKTVPKTPLRSFVGDHNVMDSALRENKAHVRASMADIRRVRCPAH